MSPLRRIRVMVASDTLNAGGAERVAVDTVNTLDRSSYEVFLCLTRTGGPLQRDVRDDVDITILGRTTTWDIPALLRFCHQVNRCGIDVIHTHGRGTMRFVALARALGLISARHVFHDHFGGMHVDRRASRVMRLAVRMGVDAYIGVDSRLCSWVSDLGELPPSSITMIRSGIDVDRFDDVEPADLRGQLDLPDDCLIAVMVANFRPQKDHPTLFRALAEVSDSARSRMQLVLCGSTSADETYFENCVAMARELGVSDMVHFVGVREDMPAVLAGADFAVMTSKNETGPLVILEFMAAGLPFVATDVGEITNAVRDLDVGLIPSPRDHHEVADALEALISMSDQERISMGRRGRRSTEELFSQAVAIKQVEKTYASVLGLAEDLRR